MVESEGGEGCPPSPVLITQRVAAQDTFGGLTGRLPTAPLKYSLTRGPSERRIQLSSGHLMVDLGGLVIQLSRKPRPEDRKLVSGVIKTKFKMGGSIKGDKFTTAQLLRKVWQKMPGTIKILVN